MIEKMKKVLFIGPDNTREAMLRDLQKKGIVQIEPYQGDAIEREQCVVETSRAERLAGVLKILKTHTPEKVPQQKEGANFETADKIVSLERELTQLREEEKGLSGKKEALARWGNFSIDELHEIEHLGNIRIQFWETSAKGSAEIIAPEAHTLVTVSQNAHNLFFLSFADHAISIDGCAESRIDTDTKKIEAALLENRQTQLAIEKELGEMNCYENAVKRLYFTEINEINFSQALGASVRPLGILFAFQGWVSSRQVNAVVECAQKHNGKLFEIEPDKDEKTPTMIRNSGIPAMGQDLVLFFDTPSNSDWDPSSIVFLSFLVFFSMIMGDAGYGLTLFALILYFRLKNRKAKPGIKRFMNMGLLLTFGTIVYGVITGSYYALPSQTPVVSKLVELKIFDPGSLKRDDLNFAMQVSILVGMIHISVSVFLKAIRQFTQLNFLQPLSNFAWIVAIWTFFFWYSGPKWGIPGHDPMQVNIMLGCAAVIFLTSAGTLHPVKLIFGGLGGLYNGVQFLSDILSYIRIFALGLSGAMIAQTFNNMATSIMQMGVWAIPLGIVIFVFGHLLNIALSIMGAVIHGLRLNFLEYFRWSFEGGGKLFRPLEDMLDKNL